MAVGTGRVPVSELVGHGEGQRQARVLVDIAAAVRLAHARHVGQAEGLAGLVHGRTQVLPTRREVALRLTWPRPAHRSATSGPHGCPRSHWPHWVTLFGPGGWSPGGREGLPVELKPPGADPRPCPSWAATSHYGDARCHPGEPDEGAASACGISDKRTRPRGHLTARRPLSAEGPVGRAGPAAPRG